MSRIDGYGRVDRSRTVTVTVDGTPYAGHPGDTVASVLLAHGARPQTTSVKYGRPRGMTSSWTEDPTGLIQVEEPFPEPMLLAATVEATDGLVVLGVGHVGLAAVGELGLLAGAAPGAGDELHGGSQGIRLSGPRRRRRARRRGRR